MESSRYNSMRLGSIKIAIHLCIFKPLVSKWFDFKHCYKNLLTSIGYSTSKHWATLFKGSSLMRILLVPIFSNLLLRRWMCVQCETFTCIVIRICISILLVFHFSLIFTCFIFSVVVVGVPYYCSLSLIKCHLLTSITLISCAFHQFSFFNSNHNLFNVNVERNSPNRSFNYCSCKLLTGYSGWWVNQERTTYHVVKVLSFYA